MDSDINLGHQGGVAVLTVFFLDWLKRSAWFPWITNNTDTINRVVSITIAIITAAGLKVVSSEGNWSTGGKLTIVYPALTVIIDTATHAAAQFGGQEILHKMLGNHNMLKQLLAGQQGVKS